MVPDIGSGYVIEDAIHKGPYNTINNWDYSKVLLNCHISRTNVQKKLFKWGRDVGKYNSRKSKYYS